MSDIPLGYLIQVGQDIIATKYYAFAALSVYLYDYFLTLPDEVRYAWSGKKTWTFWLFIVNRYFPFLVQLWVLVLVAAPPSRGVTELYASCCGHTFWYTMFDYAVSSFVAQVVLTVRMYAVSRKNIPITTMFAAITVSQVVVEIVLVSMQGRGGVQPVPAIPLDAYNLCVYRRHRKLELTFNSLSLLYDTLAFLLTIFFAMRTKSSGVKVPTILGTIAEDATMYFLVIFSSHIVLQITMIFGRSTIQLLPGMGTVSFLPVMIGRIMLSLRKAADSQRADWNLTEVSPNFSTRPTAIYLHNRNTTGGARSAGANEARVTQS